MKLRNAHKDMLKRLAYGPKSTRSFTHGDTGNSQLSVHFQRYLEEMAQAGLVVVISQHGEDLWHITEHGRKAMEAPKVHCQGRDTFVDEALPEAVKAELARRGHNVIEQRDHPGLNAFARVNAVSADPASGELRGAAFPGWRGDASAL